MPEQGATAAKPLPPTCFIRRWRVFTNGWHKSELYTPAQVQRIAENFRRLRGHMHPRVGLGHDREQRLKASLGMPSAGEIEAVEASPAGDLYLTIGNVPTWLGAQIEAKRYRDGSVELKPGYPNPADPAKRIDGPVLDGVAFLGDEQPAVKGCDRPRATFADGSFVPPSWDPLPVPSPGPSPPVRRDFADTAVTCFSETTTVTPEALIAALQSLTPEQLQQVLAAIQPPAPPAEPAPAPAPPAGGDQFAAFADKMDKCFADVTGRLGAVEKFAEESQKKKDADSEEMFSEQAARVVDRAIASNLVLRRDKARFVREGVEVQKTKQFGEVKANAFAAWEADLMGRPKLFGQDAIPDGPAPQAGLTPFQRQMLESDSMKRHAPQVRAKLLSK